MPFIYDIAKIYHCNLQKPGVIVRCNLKNNDYNET